MTLLARERSSRCTTAGTPTVTTTHQRQGDTADVGSEADPQAQLRAALAANTRRLTGTTGTARQTLLLNRAQLWEELAQTVTPPCAQAYRKTASVCRQEAGTLNTSACSDLHDGWGEKAP